MICFMMIDWHNTITNEHNMIFVIFLFLIESMFRTLCRQHFSHRTYFFSKQKTIQLREKMYNLNIIIDRKKYIKENSFDLFFCFQLL